ncbi:MAG: ATP-binding protein [Nitrososphaerales archaeon]
MLLDPNPKTRREDFYNREKELEELINSLRRMEKLIVILGIRRIGKSSLLNVALSELDIPNIKLDIREIYFTKGSISKFHLYEALSEEINKLRRFKGLLRILSKVRGVTLAGLEVKLDWRERETSISSLLKAMDKWCERANTNLVIALDEAQYLRFSGRVRYDGIIAWALDNLNRISFVLTGSEVGMLRDFLRLEQSDSPLYGRFVKTLKLERLERERAKDFLLKGLEQFKVSPPNELEQVIDELDGLIGWLSHYGYTFATEGKADLMYFLNRASALVEEEMRKVLKGSERYLPVLKAVALGASTWSEVYNAISSKLGPIPKSEISTLLSNLVGYGFLEKRNDSYFIPDSVVKYTASRIKA